MSIKSVFMVFCDRCNRLPQPAGVYFTYPEALAHVEKLGWFLSPERDNSRFVFCPDCMRAEADKILQRARN